MSRRFPRPKDAPYGLMDTNSDVTIRHPDGRPMTQAEITKMAADAKAESDAWEAADEQGQRDILDKMTGGMFSKLF